MPLLSLTRDEAEALAGGEVLESVREKATRAATPRAPVVIEGQTDIYEQLAEVPHAA